MKASLLDSFTRHQVYLEGYKNGLDGKLDPMLREMHADLRRTMADLSSEDMGDLTKKQLAALIATIQRLQVARNDAFRAVILQELREFASADTQLNRRIMEDHEGKGIAAGAGVPLIGRLAVKDSPKGRAALWASVRNTADPATGLKPAQLVNQYLGFVSRNVKQTIIRAHANKWTIKETLAALIGTRKNRFKDGFVARARRAGASMLHTVVQHVSSHVQAGVASIFYKYYEWVSVLDMSTSKICLHRDGLSWKYGKGPLPPAHIRCRSRAVPIPKGQAYKDPGTFYGWLGLQPAAVQDDIIGKSLGGGLRSGRVTASSLGRFRTTQQLTLEQFLSKFRLIILTAT